MHRKNALTLSRFPSVLFAKSESTGENTFSLSFIAVLVRPKKNLKVL